MAYTNDVTWPGWNVSRRIGKGSFGAVYEIERSVFGEVEKAALKVISIPENDSDIDELRHEGYAEESITERFRSYLEDIVKEYSTMAKMKGHTNVVYCDDVKYVQHDDGIGWDIYIKMELLTPIMKCLDRFSSEREIIQLGIDLSNALILCKERNIVHRDIKPQNIFVSQDGNYKLGDFGIAKTAEHTTGGTKIGTYKYMAPEVYKSEPYGTAADQYSLGLVLYWLLNEKRTPFLPLPPQTPTANIEDEARRRRFSGEPLPLPVSGSEELQQIVMKACAYSPRERFGSAEELHRALVALERRDESREKLEAPKSLKPIKGHLQKIEDAEPQMNSSDTEAERDTDKDRDRTELLDRPKEVEAELGELTLQEQATEKVPPNVQTPIPPKTTSTSKAEKMTFRPKRQKRKLTGIIAAVLCIVLLGIGLSTILSRNANNVFSFLRPRQQTWTEWNEELPSFVTDEDYDIESRTLYRTKELETTTSDKSTMDGWELFETEEGTRTGEWSEWSEKEQKASDTLEVEKELRFRYRDKETKTSTSSSMSGWESAGTSEVFGDYSAWSEWSINPISSSNTREVETKTQYRYREVILGTVSLDGSGLFDPGSLITSGTPTYGEWTEWTDDASAASASQYVETRMVYRYRDRTVSTIYSYYRWGEWSEWNTTKVTESETREVETRDFYRSRDIITEPTYHFRRWSDWSEYITTERTASDTVMVETKEEYRFKSK